MDPHCGNAYSRLRDELLLNALKAMRSYKAIMFPDKKLLLNVLPFAVQKVIVLIVSASIKESDE